MCDAKIVSQRGATVICRCADCHGLYIWNNNLVLNFTAHQFARFRQFTQKLVIADYTLPFPDGQERVVMRTPANDVNLTFTPDEWENFNAAMEEATLMLQVYELTGG